jgi:predicted RNA binding protein YcfA (HicA-like mRNA interferase family)
VKLPRDVAGDDLVRALAQFGYQVTRQKDSHIRLTTRHRGEHHVTIPRHDPLRIGTLSAVLDMVATHLGVTRQEFLGKLFR